MRVFWRKVRREGGSAVGGGGNFGAGLEEREC